MRFAPAVLKCDCLTTHPGYGADVTRVSAAPLRRLCLAAIAAAFALVAKSSAVEPYRLPSGKPKNERLDEEKSMKAHMLTPYRNPKVSPYTPRKTDFPARYTRKNEGTKRVSR